MTAVYLFKKRCAIFFFPIFGSLFHCKFSLQIDKSTYIITQGACCMCYLQREDSFHFAAFLRKARDFFFLFWKCCEKRVFSPPTGRMGGELGRLRANFWKKI